MALAAVLLQSTVQCDTTRKYILTRISRQVLHASGLTKKTCRTEDPRRHRRSISTFILGSFAKLDPITTVSLPYGQQSPSANMASGSSDYTALSPHQVVVQISRNDAVVRKAGRRAPQSWRKSRFLVQGSVLFASVLALVLTARVFSGILQAEPRCVCWSKLVG